jgi:NAD-dependent dihydropyrimidine dehydrogenase PreA subunit
MAISHINVEECIGCGTCVETCPADVIRLDKETGKAKITYPEDCQSCALCRNFCLVSRYVITISPQANLEPMMSWG